MSELNCKHDNCNIKASYGFKTDKIKLYCIRHKNDEMIYLYKCCNYKDCLTVSSFGYIKENKKINLRCKKHKELDMISLHQLCIEDDCINRARYNYINEKGSRYCNIHKKENMFDKNKAICIIDNCNKYASFKDKETHKNLYCTDHSKNQKNIISSKNKICKYENCNILANFGTIEDPRQYCTNHKLEKMENYNCLKCQICKIFEMRRTLICSFCNPESYIKKYEKLIYDTLLKNNIEFIYNKPISFEYLRPDFLIKQDQFNIIIECDEKQHKQYDKNSEFIRMKKIKNYINKKCIFIRFNTSEFYLNLKRKRICINKKIKELLNVLNNLKNLTEINKSYIYYLYYDCNCINECNYIHIQNI